MGTLPMPVEIMNETQLQARFNFLFFQAEDQAKAAIRNHHPINSNRTAQWFLIIGPFSDKRLSVHAQAHKQSNSGDFAATIANYSWGSSHHAKIRFLSRETGPQASLVVWVPFIC